MNDDVIQIIIDAKTEQADKARAKLDGLGNQVIALKDQLDQGKISVGAFERSFERLDSKIAGTRQHISGLENDIKGLGGKLQGGARTSAKFQLGLAGANIAQDVAQGGPAAGVNNILGLAGNNGVRALAGEFVAAAGGAKVLAAGFGTIAVAAGAAFVTINEGLKSANLGWSDLGSVVDEMAGGIFAKAAQQMGEDIGSVWGQVKDLVGGIAETTIGWNSAAEAVRAHKDEIDRASAALEGYLKAQKAIAGIKSDAQSETDKRGKLFGKELAELGGDKGLDAIIDELAGAEAGRDPDRMETVTRRRKVKDSHGKEEEVQSTESITARQRMKEAITQDFANAIGGDKASQDALKKRLAGLGKDVTGLDSAQAGVDRKDAEKEAAAKDEDEEYAQKSKRDTDKFLRKSRAERKKAKEAKDREVAEAEQDALDGNAAIDRGIKAEKEKLDRDSLEKADKRSIGTGLEGRTELATMRSMLAGGTKDQILQRVEEALTEEFKSRGLEDNEAAAAARQKAEAAFGKVGDEAVSGAMGPGKQPEARAPERISVGDFARSVESAGSSDTKKLVDINTQMKERLEELVRLGRQPARAG
jgi:hypothetical protein